jgi:hypothetical protein
MAETKEETHEEWLERVRSVGSIQSYKPGATKKKVVMNELDGKPGGYHTEHYDGSQDANAIPRPIAVKASVKGDTDG